MKLAAADITTHLASHPGWTLKDNALTRQFQFPAFPDAITFVTRLAFAAEAADHHPDLLISYRKVTVSWSTHDEGGVTEKDFAGLKQSQTIATQLGAKG